VTALRSGSLAAWTSAWLAGFAASDEVISAITGRDQPHQVVELDPLGAVPLSEALIQWRRQAGPVRVVLPIAGDVRGLPGPAAFRTAALQAGEAAIGGALALVPRTVDHPVSSAPPTVVWTAFEVEPQPADPLTVPEAHHDLTEAIRESASALAAAEVAGGADVGEALARARRAGEHVNLPPGHPPRAVQLVAQAERLSAVLRLAGADPHGGAVDRVGITARTEALRPLATAVRRARMAGYNAGSAPTVG
jgi:hypothetical protein